ncbi:Lrp/AsnC family transcriptional regulator [Pseudophaeobacter sp.]|uniref:Lrp/AsnC family transcriptional regulator n=1 Tax=Pseudophaeobacter sp. TaxID=1971739 RepID=UPI004059ED58
MPKMDLDAVDVRILRELQADSRLSNVELAGRVGLSASPCLARVRALTTSGLIKRHVTLLDPQLLGLNLTVFVNVSLINQSEPVLQAFQAAIDTCSEVMECYLMTGDSDYLLRVIVADVQELRAFILNRLTTIEAVSGIRSSIALDQVKYETALPIKDVE